MQIFSKKKQGLIVALLLSFSSPGQAQTPEEKTAARAAAEAGTAALRKGRYDEAIRLIRRAEAAFHAPTHLLLLAEAQEKKGDLVESREILLRVKHETLAMDAPEAFRHAKQESSKRLQALEPRLPKVTVHLDAENSDGVAVLVDDKRLPAAAVGIPYPVNPGKHTIVAKAGELVSAPVEVELAEGQSESISLKLELVREENTAAPATASEPEESPAQQPDQTATGADPDRRWMIYTGFGVGLAGVAMGTVTGVLALNKNKSLTGDGGSCVDNLCPVDAESDVNQAKTMGTLSTVGFAVGGAGIALGVAGLFLNERPLFTSSGGGPAVVATGGPGFGYVQGTWRFQ